LIALRSRVAMVVASSAAPLREMLDPTVPSVEVWEAATKEVQKKYAQTNEYLVEHGARIVIVGSTGVGKSSVLNACFKQKALAAVGAAVPMTGHCSKSIMYYPANTECTVHLYDTKGFEAMVDNRDILNALTDLVYQRKQAAEKAAAKFGPESPQFHAERIHCLWWVTADRLEAELAKRMADIFREIPIIIIANKSDKSADAVDAVIAAATAVMKSHEKSVKAVIPVACDPKNGPLKKICPVCKSSKIAVTAADDDEKGTYMCKNKDCANFKMDIELRDAYGIDELLKSTVQLLPEMVAASFSNAQKDYLQDLIL